MINIDYKKEREGQVFINKLGTQIKVINYIADKYQDVIPDMLYQALYLYEVEIND